MAVNCELLPGCPFFNDKMAKMPATAELMKNYFCRGSNSSCARFMVYKKFGREKVPSDLAPSDIEKALLLLSAT